MSELWIILFTKSTFLQHVLTTNPLVSVCELRAVFPQITNIHTRSQNPSLKYQSTLPEGYAFSNAPQATKHTIIWNCERHCQTDIVPTINNNSQLIRQTFKHWHPGFVFICDVGGRGLISHKFEGAGEGGAGVCTEGRPRSCARVHGAAGCEPGVQLAVAWWARLAAGRVHYGRAAGGCPMGQAGSWVGVLWACSWRLPDGPGWQLGGCTMGAQLAVARWARLAAGRVHYGRAAGGCPTGQAGSWECTMGVQLAVARWARLAAGVHKGHAMAIPARCRGCRTRMICRRDLFLTQKLWWWQVILLKLYIYIFRYHISTVLYMRLSKA